MPSNPDAESFRLRYGPYHPPKVQVGDEIQCERWGRVEVVDWHDCGEIMWPRCRIGNHRCLILAGDLVRACRLETALAVGKHWGVSQLLVGCWKRALGAPFRTPGTEAVASLKSHIAALGKPASPKTRAALLRAAKRPKSEQWKKQAVEWLRKEREP